MTDPDNRLIAWRVQKLEESQETLAQSMHDISESIIAIRAWGKVVTFMFGIVHPVLVGLVIKAMVS